MHFGNRINLGEMRVYAYTSPFQLVYSTRQRILIRQRNRHERMMMKTTLCAFNAVEIIYSIRKTIEWPFHIKLYLANT